MAELPAAAEVAAYNIVIEALTNVVRHAGAARCAVRLAFDHGLLIEIADDGRGVPVGFRAGVGIRSMLERTEELGGTLAVRPRPGGGTIVAVRIPLEERPGV